jgi:hypothetical protein
MDDISHKEAQKAQSGHGPPPACPPLHQPFRFPGYLNYIINSRASPENLKKKILEHGWTSSRIWQVKGGAQT